MDDCEAKIETTLALMEFAAAAVRFAACSARNAVRETRQQCANSQRFARIVSAMDAEPSKPVAAAPETITYA